MDHKVLFPTDAAAAPGGHGLVVAVCERWPKEGGLLAQGLKANEREAAR